MAELTDSTGSVALKAESLMMGLQALAVKGLTVSVATMSSA